MVKIKDLLSLGKTRLDCVRYWLEHSVKQSLDIVSICLARCRKDKRQRPGNSLLQYMSEEYTYMYSRSQLSHFVHCDKMKLEDTMEIVPTLWHKDDPHDNETLQHEIRKWSRSNTKGLLLSQLGFNVHPDSEKADLLAQQAIRWSWEVESVQTCTSRRGLTYHPVRTAWLWMEEYGADFWPEVTEKRKHLDPSLDFVYLRDRTMPSEAQAKNRLDVDGNMADFCFKKNTLHPHNSIFQSVLQFFAGVHAGLWHNVDYTVCRDRTAAELMADFLESEPWIPSENLLPLYYDGLPSESDGSCESCDCSACNSSRNSAELKKRPAILESGSGNVDFSGVPEDPMDGMES